MPLGFQSMSAEQDSFTLVAKNLGWFMYQCVGAELIYLNEDTMTEASFDAYLALVDSRLRKLALGTYPRRGVLVEVVSGRPFMNASRRQKLANALSGNLERFAQVIVGVALVTESAFARGVMTALSWLAPHQAPMRSFRTTQSGLEWLSTMGSNLDIVQVDACWALAKIRHGYGRPSRLPSAL